MKYNPDKHHRRSIRLKGYDYSSPGVYFITICTHQRQCLFGEIVDGEMQLNSMGQLVRSHWLKLPHHHAHVKLDAWVIMPNHIHGILILNNPGRGAALGQDSEHPTENFNPNATPPPDRAHTKDNPNATPAHDRAHTKDNSNATPAHDCTYTNFDALSTEPGVAFGRKSLSSPSDGLPNAAPLPLRLGAGTVGAIVLNFKSVTTRSFNRIKQSPGNPIWQRNYYEHIIRSEESFCRIRQYIHNNPLVWQQDQLRPGHSSHNQRG